MTEDSTSTKKKLTTLVVHNAQNGNWKVGSDHDSAAAINVIFWGGELYNVGEDKASVLVQKRYQDLQGFIYLPRWHKGGRMVRPHYGRKSDRDSTMTFPTLTTLGYFEDMGTPLRVKWVVPNLKTLYLFQGKSANQWRLRWTIAARGERSLPERVLEQCPDLVEVLFCARPNFFDDPTLPPKAQVLLRLVPPRPMPWECLRLLLIAVRKPTTSGNCAMGKLPEAAMDCIVSFCHSTKWKEQEFSQEDAAKLRDLFPGTETHFAPKEYEYESDSDS